MYEICFGAFNETIISSGANIEDHTVGWLVKLIGKMFGTGDFDAENTVKNTSNQYMNTDNSKTTNNVTINTTGDVDMDSINEALGGAYWWDVDFILLMKSVAPCRFGIGKSDKDPEAKIIDIKEE